MTIKMTIKNKVTQILFISLLAINGLILAPILSNAEQLLESPSLNEYAGECGISAGNCGS